MITNAGLAAAGEFLGGVGSIASAFGGDSRDPIADTRAANYLALVQHNDLTAQDFNLKMKLAKNHGIHPLSVLGVPSPGAGFSPILSYGGTDTGPDFSAIGYGANQIAKSFVDPPAPVEDRQHEDPRQARLIDAQVRLAEARAGEAEVSQIMAMNNLLGQPGNPPGVRASNDVNAASLDVARMSGLPLSYFSAGAASPSVEVKQQVAPPHPSKTGHAAATDQHWLTVRDQSGRDVSVVNPQAINADLEKGATYTALAKIFGAERAMQITAVMENEGLLMGGAVAAGYGLKQLFEYIHGRSKGKPNPRQFKAGKWRERR